MKPTVVQLILNAPAFAKSIMLAASASAHKTLLSLTKSDVGLSNVDNTSDVNKPVSTAQQTAIDARALQTITITGGTGLSGGGDLSANRSIALANTAVTAGAYTAANITVDAQGRITAAANGSAGIGGTVGTVTNRIPRSSGTGGSTLQASGITVDASDNVSGVVGLTATGTASVLSVVTGNTTGGLCVQGSLASGLNVLNSSGFLSLRNINGGNGIRFQNFDGSAEWMRMNNSARLLIGTTSDDGSSRVQISGNMTISGVIGLGTYTVATLPSAAANAGRIAQVTDSSVTANGSTVAGGGANRVMVFSNGTTWDVVVA